LPTISLEKYDTPGKLKSFFKELQKYNSELFCRNWRNPRNHRAKKNQNARKCNMRLVGCALKEGIHTYVLFSPNVQVLSVENPQKSRSYIIFGNPGRVVRFLQK
jgi:hypothetical protein